ncbi:MAG: heat-inducible transcriptional repressor HrcA [Actinobacteria bacterium]|nr:heat-inducible transcriptional repressor HrcA [Actinomycetota bacterium]MBU1943552.1 heat-inducible transcriptional repressor HrcA [Actinomycetota bacterium]MBU2687561.1 heat-inducible transcriptional repressor HrcA [Actinomycetota bacterium]
MISEIDRRKKKILQAVVQSFILTGKPVGSGTVARISGLKVSSATIRNEMGVLEDLGLLSQPHTSAGRVPTDLAYRFYVDMLMDQHRPSSQDAKAVEKLFEARSREMEGMLQEASLLLGRLTHTTAMVFAPFSAGDTVRHVDVVRFGVGRAMVIIVTTRGQVGRRLVSMDSEVTDETLERVSAFLDRELSGRGAEAIDPTALKKKARLPKGGAALLQVALEVASEYLGAIDERVYIGGTANIVRELEGEGSESVQVLLEALEKQYFILDLLKDLLREGTLTVRIGEENRLAELRRCAFVGTSYPLAGGLFGSLGVVGPVYMDYGRTIGVVELMAENLGRRLLSSSD